MRLYFNTSKIDYSLRNGQHSNFWVKNEDQTELICSNKESSMTKINEIKHLIFLSKGGVQIFLTLKVRSKKLEVAILNISIHLIASYGQKQEHILTTFNHPKIS